jgi:hypothetical protein
MKDLTQIQNELKAPFHPDDIEWRVGSTNSDKTKGLALAYITNRAIQNRLDDVFGIAGWKNEFKDWKGSGVLCGLSCFVNEQWITKWDGAEETNMEATKGGISDAMKRAGYQWGIGRYLYKLDSQWVELEQRGRSYAIKPGKEPRLPDWALPEGFKYGNKPSQQPRTPPQRATQQDALKPLEIIKCADCQTEIKPAVNVFSMRNFNKPLCMDCQKKQKKEA